MKIVTGYTGVPHVTSDDMASFQQGIVGLDDYILYSGTDFSGTAIAANTIQLSKAELVMQGVHARIEGNEQVTIAAGTTNMYRTDLIVARYTKDELGVEKVEIAVVQGEASQSASAYPEVEKQDLRNGGTKREAILLAVELYGSVIQNITKVIDTLVPLSLLAKNPSFRDSLKVEKGTGRATLATGVYGSTAYVTLTCRNNDPDNFAYSGLQLDSTGRLILQGGDYESYDIPFIVYGTSTIAANKNSVEVTFEFPFLNAPTVVCSSTGTTTPKDVCANSISQNGCTIYRASAESTALKVNWVAIGTI